MTRSEAFMTNAPMRRSGRGRSLSGLHRLFARGRSGSGHRHQMNPFGGEVSIVGLGNPRYGYRHAPRHRYRSNPFGLSMPSMGSAKEVLVLGASAGAGILAARLIPSAFGITTSYWRWLAMIASGLVAAWGVKKLWGGASHAAIVGGAAGLVAVELAGPYVQQILATVLPATPATVAATTTAGALAYQPGPSSYGASSRYGVGAFPKLSGAAMNPGANPYSRM